MNTDVLLAKIEEVLKEESPDETSKDQNEKNENASIDPYSYLKRGEFCNENFKIQVKNMPKYYGINEFKKLLNQTLNLNSAKVKQTMRNANYMFVCFHNDEERAKACAVLNETVWKGSQLSAVMAVPSADPFLMKRRREFAHERSRKLVKLDVPLVDQLIDQAVPLHNMPYEEQLIKKQATIYEILKRHGRKLYRNEEISDYIAQQQIQHNGLPCQLLDAKSAPVVNGYRNKCEFTVGVRQDNNEKTVGLRIGMYSEGNVGVGPIDNLPHIPDAMKVAARVFEQYVRASPLGVFNPVDHSGVFKQLVVRTTSNKELMLVVGVSPKALSDEQIATLQRDLVAFFTEGEGREAGVTSLYYQSLTLRRSADDDSSRPVHLHGATHNNETLLGLHFRVSPEAFFQVNTASAEILYATAMELAGITKQATVVDVCCGTGTIGLCAAAKCDQVLGLDCVSEAIEDARINARNNGITNAEFFCGKAEVILTSVVSRARNDEVIAIVDPPRAGLHKSAIVALRRVSRIKKIVFIACNPKKATENFMDFARPASKTIQGVPFVPTKAVLVDMFPHTEHNELVTLLERLDSIVPDSDVAKEEKPAVA